MDNVCDTNLVPSEVENLNEATPASLDVSKDAGCTLANVVECDDAISSTTSDKFSEQLTLDNVEADADFFASELNISNIPTEKTSENVEDIVQDLENLLGESNDSYRFSRETIDNSKLSDTYDEVNSSNMEDFVQETDLYEIEDVNLHSSTVECGLGRPEVVMDNELMAGGDCGGNNIEPEVVLSVERLADAVVDSTEILDAAFEVSTDIIESDLPDEANQQLESNVEELISESKVEDLNFITEELPGLNEVDVIEQELQQNFDDVAVKTIESAIADSIETPECVEALVDNSSDFVEETEPGDIPAYVDDVVEGECSEDGNQCMENDTNSMEIPINSSSNDECVEEVIANTNESMENMANQSDACVEAVIDNSIEEKEDLNVNIPECIENIIDNNADCSNYVWQNEDKSVENTADEIDKSFQNTDENLIDESIIETQNQEVVSTDNNTDFPDYVWQNEDKLDEEADNEIDESFQNINDNLIDESIIETRNEDDASIISSSTITEPPESTCLMDRNTDFIQPLTVEVEEPTFKEQQPEVSSNQEPDEEELHEEPETSPDQELEVPTEPEIIENNEVQLQTDRAPLKITISKDKSDNTHSILKIYDPNDPLLNQDLQVPKLIIKSTPSTSSEESAPEEPSIPKITIKPIIEPSEPQAQHSPKITIKPIKPPTENQEQNSPRSNKCVPVGSGSPRITIKPILKPEVQSPLKLTIRPIPKIEDTLSNTKLTIKPIVKPPDEENHHSPKITIKPIKPPEEMQPYTEEKHSPRITIKPIPKPPEELSRNDNENVSSPRITIKPIPKPQDEPQDVQQPYKLNIKPVPKPAETNLSPKITKKSVASESVELVDFEEQIKQERIVLKIAKNVKKEKTAIENEKLKKIKLKLSKEDGLAHIVPIPQKRPSTEEPAQMKYFKSDPSSEVTLSLVTNTPNTTTSSSVDTTLSSIDVNMSEDEPKNSPSVDNEILSAEMTETSSSRSLDEVPDPLADIPVFEIMLETSGGSRPAPPVAVAPPVPRKRGRPRKVPLEVREEFKDFREEEVVVTPAPVLEESTRPKRTCRGASVRATLGIKPRKPRGSSRGRGRGRGRAASTAASGRRSKERKPYMTKSRIARELMLKESELRDLEFKDVEFKQVPLPAEVPNQDVVIYEEETRMSADNSSRAQTPAKQVLTPAAEVIDESQSSVQSNTTTESGEKIQKARKGPRLEVHQEPEGEVISADKLAEYSWGGGGPYMLQEQVAQFLGIKSFKRKYPGIQRRPVDMQERDFIRESCLASEAMCDMGLTAVKSEDILDIMYTDFQPKYEEYCKHQRDRQAKDVSNKQKALSLAASQEKNKIDIVEQAVQSAFQWNATFNKARREQRRACMDLQTFTVHFPKGKMKQVNKPPVGTYPLALVPGQFTDYYKKYTPYDLSNLPLNTIGCKNIISMHHDTEESQSDASGSDSDSSSSDSDSSYSGSSGAEDCKMCTPSSITARKLLAH